VRLFPSISILFTKVFPHYSLFHKLYRGRSFNSTFSVNLVCPQFRPSQGFPFTSDFFSHLWLCGSLWFSQFSSRGQKTLFHGSLSQGEPVSLGFFYPSRFGTFPAGGFLAPQLPGGGGFSGSQKIPVFRPPDFFPQLKFPALGSLGEHKRPPLFPNKIFSRENFFIHPPLCGHLGVLLGEEITQFWSVRGNKSR